MKIIQKTLSGLVSFRGVGFVDVGGIQVGICGSKQINCGAGCNVRWVDIQLQMVPLEAELVGVKMVTLNVYAVAAGEWLVRDTDGKDLLYYGHLEGLNLGGLANGADYALISPPFSVAAKFGNAFHHALFPHFSESGDLSPDWFYMTMA